MADMKKFEKKYFCTNCRQEVSALNELYFIEEDSQKGFCGEMCIEKYYLPVVEQLEKNDENIKNRDTFHTGEFDHLNNNNDVVERIFSEPDEVYFQKNEVGETLYFFIKNFQKVIEAYQSVICIIKNQVLSIFALSQTLIK